MKFDHLIFAICLVMATCVVAEFFRYQITHPQIEVQLPKTEPEIKTPNYNPPFEPMT